MEQKFQHPAGQSFLLASLHPNGLGDGRRVGYLQDLYLEPKEIKAFMVLFREMIDWLALQKAEVFVHDILASEWPSLQTRTEWKLFSPQARPQLLPDGSSVQILTLYCPLSEALRNFARGNELELESSSPPPPSES